MKRNNWIGLIFFFIFLALEWAKLHPVETIFLFGALCLLPLTLNLIDQKDRDGKPFGVARALGIVYPFAAVSGLLAFVYESFGFALVWLLFTSLVAMLGLRRLLERGFRPVGEVCIDFGLMYLLISGCWFVAYIAKWEVMGFSGLIVLLTANHFQYSAFFLPVIVGLLNRRMEDLPVAIIVILSQMTVAIGITYSKAFELVAVGILFLALLRIGIKVWITPFEKKAAKWLLRISASLLILTITFSLLYAIGMFRGKILLSIPEMIWTHGIMNAFGVILLGLIGMHIEAPKPSEEFYGKPVSSIRGSWRIGGDFLRRRNLISSKKYLGLVDNMAVFKSIPPNKLPAAIIDFYENTIEYELWAKITWEKWFLPFAYVYHLFSKRVQQIHLSMFKDWQVMAGEIIGINSKKDGRADVRAWVRQNELGETIFVALYLTITVFQYDWNIKACEPR